MGSGLILGIESSCDETAAAVVRGGTQVLSNVVASQVALHALHGGVVPELAAREHLQHIVPVVRAAMAQAGIGFAELDAIAVTEGPGLAGALLVGILYAKSLALGLSKPLIGVNHLEGHIHAVVMDARSREELEFPQMALVVSGGHTHLYLASERDGVWSYRNVGRTVDDAAGEAYDKVAKLLGLGYPGGPWMDVLAAYGNADAVKFNFHAIKPREGETETRFDLSFSGTKTAALRYVQAAKMQDAIAVRQAILRADPERTAADSVELLDQQTLDLIASFQGAVVSNLVRQTFAAVEHCGARGVLVSGGVAANRDLRKRFLLEGERRNLRVSFPGAGLSTDNAAMIAAAAWPRFMTEDFAADEMIAVPQLRLG